MAITQISQITVRKGLQQDLPQLAGGEFGWAIDTSNLYIGNGTLAEGAAAVGLTQIATADMVAGTSSYRYSGPGSVPVMFTQQRTFQDKMSDIVSVKDFGAVGDSILDCHPAFANALNFVYRWGSQDPNVEPQLRKTLYIPAGNYRISNTLIFTSYVNLVGDGANRTTLWLDSVSNDLPLLQNSNANAVTDVSIQNMTLHGYANVLHLAEKDINNIDLKGLRFEMTSSNFRINTSAIRLYDDANVSSMTVSDCDFFDTGVGIYKASVDANVVNDINIVDSVFSNLYQGIYVGDSMISVGPPLVTDVVISRNIFNNVVQPVQSYISPRVDRLTSVQNIYTNCAPAVGSLIDYRGANFFGTAEMFDGRAEGRFNIVNVTTSIFNEGTQAVNLGAERKTVAKTISVTGSDPVVQDQTIVTLNANVREIVMDYSFTTSDPSDFYRRTGTWRAIANTLPNDHTTSEEYNELGTSRRFNISWNLTESNLKYNSDSDGTMIFSITTYTR